MVITDPTGASALVGDPSAAAAGVLVAGPDAAAVGAAVARLRAAGRDAAGWVGDPSDEALQEMAAELFPGAEITVRG